MNWIMMQKWWRKFFHPQPGFEHGPLEPKDSVVPMSHAVSKYNLKIRFQHFYILFEIVGWAVKIISYQISQMLLIFYQKQIKFLNKVDWLNLL